MTEDGNETPVERTPSLNANGKRPLESTSAAKKADKAKRVRVSRACDQCRAGREKCDGAQPICHTCETQNRSCTYNEKPKKRGIQPNYIRTLELTLAWIIQQFPDSEAQLSQLLPRTHEQAHRVISFKDVTAAENLHAAWRNGIISRQVEALLSGSDIEAPPAGSSRAISIAPYQSPPLSVPSDTGVLQSEQQEVTVAANANASSARKPQHEQLFSRNSLVLPEDSWALLEHYFTFTQTWLPITEKHDIMRLMYSYPAQGLSRTQARAAEHSELWSIMAWSALSIGPQSRTSFGLCYDVAKSIIPTDDGVQMGHVKALLILGIVEIARNSHLAAWLMIGSAVRVLTHYQGGQGLEVALGGTRTKHTVLAAFLLEQVIASQSGATGHLNRDDVQALGLLVEDGLEEWEPWNDPAVSSSSILAKAPARSISTFNALVRLALHPIPRDESLVQSPPSSSSLSVVFDLLRNSSAGKDRRHPMSILAAQDLGHTPRFQQSVGSSLSQAGILTGQHHARTISSATAAWMPQPSNVDGAYIEQHYPFMSIPNEATETLAGSGPAQSTSPAGLPGPWSTDNTKTGADDAFNFDADNVDHAMAGGGDIFEELAMLERTDSTHNPNFMQNLGFGPDLDLAEFFGADYQPTDPLLAYMQPETFGELPQDLDGNAEDAG